VIGGSIAGPVIVPQAKAAASVKAPERVKTSAKVHG
jgi:hypothetical protein